jgi:hypothetical protein
MMPPLPAPPDMILAGHTTPDAIPAGRARTDAISTGIAPPNAIPAGHAPPDTVPAPRNAGSTVDGYWDYFTQGGSSSSGSAATGDFGPFSQALSHLQLSPNYTSPRCDMDNLDLNSQANNFPFLDAYSGYL